MKSTGVTRKIDELGRLVIPKEIRRNLGIRDGESLEIFIDDDSIILKKHSQIKNYEDISNKLCDLITSVYKLNIIITDRDKVIASSNNLLLGKYLNKSLLSLIDNREEKQDCKLLVFDNLNLEGNFIIVPIIASIDSLGLIIIEANNTDCNINLAKLISKILSEKVNI